jgi:hypothetical protein
VSDPILDREALEECLRLVADEAARYLAGVDEALVRPPAQPDAVADLGGTLPDEGAGSLEALRVLIDAADVAATRSTGPRFFQFVMAAGRQRRLRPIG